MTFNPLLVRTLKKAGIVYPRYTIRYAKLNDIPLEVGCAVLMQETGGGLNEFGHDPTIFVGAGLVTKGKYLAYAMLRDRVGENQGVGPMQLTSRGLQVQADSLGGCWKPRWNIAVGFHYLGQLVKQHGGVHAGLLAYNGSGPAAERYADHVLALAQHFKTLLGK